MLDRPLGAGVFAAVMVVVGVVVTVAGLAGERAGWVRVVVVVYAAAVIFMSGGICAMAYVVARAERELGAEKAAAATVEQRQLLDRLQAAIERRPDVFSSPVLAALIVAGGGIIVALLALL